MKYYYIKSKKLFAKSIEIKEKKYTRYEYYLYKNGGWVKDTESIVMDRIMGYDPHEDDFYAFGNIEVTEDLEEITEEEFEKRCNQETSQKK